VSDGPGGPGFLARLGLAITHPAWALATAADRRHAGRSGTDLLLAILLVVLATQLRGLVAAAWLGSAVEASLGLRAAVQVLTRALTVELAFLLVAAFGLWLAGGARRELGRAFDLACVVVLPLVFVQLVATVIVRTLGLDVPGGLGFVLTGLSFAWAGALVALAIRPARQRAASVPAPPPPVLRRARLAGAGVLAVCALGTAVQAVWVARHTEAVRPMTDGEPAPDFALPGIGPKGALGERLALSSLRGKVVVLDFWATWCGPCLQAMPKLDAIARAHPDDVEVVAINLDDAVAARALWDERTYDIALLADDGEVSSRYGVSSLPHTVVIDREGVVRRVARGNVHDLDRTVAQIVSEAIRK